MRISPTTEQLDYLSSLGVPVAATTTRSSSSITVRQPHQPRRVASGLQAGEAKRNWTPAMLVACIGVILILVVGCLVAVLAYRGFTFGNVRPQEAIEQRPINGALKVAGPAANGVGEPEQDRQAVLERVEKINRDLDDIWRRLEKEELP